MLSYNKRLIGHVVFYVLVNLVSYTAGRTSDGVRKYSAEENIWTEVREAVNRRGKVL
jgi:DNA topoisomerase VI subunit B